MKYYIKATNKWTGESIIMTVPVFTDIPSAKKFVKDFSKYTTKAGKFKVVKGGRK